ncbi:hypothetical protein [Streptosporangium sp. NPDC051022]|uniref:hypothetical protein n=1 Tax=Streptosporangium sp. NPDC051022 TaxID=3155752 RepID=UPI00341EB6A1
MLVVLALAALVVLAGVVVVAMGQGGELAGFAPDIPPLDLPEAARLGAADFMALQLPVSLVGYHTQSVDEALNRVVNALSERDTRIAVLEQRVAELLAGRLQARQELHAAPLSAPRTEHEPAEPRGPEGPAELSEVSEPSSVSPGDGDEPDEPDESAALEAPEGPEGLAELSEEPRPSSESSDERDEPAEPEGPVRPEGSVDRPSGLVEPEGPVDRPSELPGSPSVSSGEREGSEELAEVPRSSSASSGEESDDSSPTTDAKESLWPDAKKQP